MFWFLLLLPIYCLLPGPILLEYIFPIFTLLKWYLSLKLKWFFCRQQKDEFSSLVYPTNLCLLVRSWDCKYGKLLLMDCVNCSHFVVYLFISVCILTPILCFSSYIFIVFFLKSLSCAFTFLQFRILVPVISVGLVWWTWIILPCFYHQPIWSWYIIF